MTMLDVIATFAPYAFVLPFVWVSLALVVAAIRVRHTQPHRKMLALLGNALIFPLNVLYAVGIFISARNLSAPAFWLIWYAFIVLHSPLFIMLILTPRRKNVPIWQPLGYTKLMDFLLLRSVPVDSTTEVVTIPLDSSSPRHPNLPPYLLMLGISIVATVLSFVGNSLRPCEWLDLATGRSGCLRILTFDQGSSFGEIAFSPDGQVMVVGRWKEPLRLYDVASGSMLRELPDQKTNCGRSVSFSIDNRQVATISEANVVSISDVQTGALIYTLRNVTDTYGIQFSPDGKYLAVSLGRAGLQLWRAGNWKLHWVIAAPIFSISFSADGRWLAGETIDDRIGIWNMEDGSVYQTIHDRAYTMALSPNGKELAAASVAIPARVWDISTGTLVRSVAADTSRNLAYSPDGQYLLATESFIQFISYIYQVGLWRTTDGRRVATLPAYNNVSCAAFAAKSDVFAYSDWKSLRVFRLRQD